MKPDPKDSLSFVPGIGTGVAAAIGAGIALAEGKTITGALIESAKGILPGGPRAQKALREAVDIVASDRPKRARRKERAR